VSTIPTWSMKEDGASTRMPMAKSWLSRHRSAGAGFAGTGATALPSPAHHPALTHLISARSRASLALSLPHGLYKDMA
jgi:hypothetical protein